MLSFDDHLKKSGSEKESKESMFELSHNQHEKHNRSVRKSEKHLFETCKQASPQSPRKRDRMTAELKIETKEWKKEKKLSKIIDK